MKSAEELKALYNLNDDMDLLEILDNPGDYELGTMEVIREIIEERGGEKALRKQVREEKAIQDQGLPFRKRIRQLLKEGKYEYDIRETLEGEALDKHAFEIWLDEELDFFEEKEAIIEKKKPTQERVVLRALIGGLIAALVGGFIFGVFGGNPKLVAIPVIVCFGVVRVATKKGFFHWANLVFSVLATFGAIFIGVFIGSAL